MNPIARGSASHHDQNMDYQSHAVNAIDSPKIEKKKIYIVIVIAEDAAGAV